MPARTINSLVMIKGKQGKVWETIQHTKGVMDKQCKVNGRICEEQPIFLSKSESVESQVILATEGTSSKPGVT